ncbi:MAG: universal stress protein [Roseiarcus sp.]|jgi:nucleotide-binding universal stress UspA family protein
MPVPFESPPSPADSDTALANATKEALETKGEFRRIAACVDASEFAEKLIPHALTVAAALGSPVTLLRVLEAKTAHAVPDDPVEWDIRLREAKNDVERLAEGRRRENQHIEAEVIEGGAAEQISLWVRNHDVELTALCTHGDSGTTTWGLGSTAQKLVDRVDGSILLIPSSHTTADPVHYRRLLVPLDGSSHAESVLPGAIRLARAEHAELVLVHVVPIPELTEVDPLEEEAIELRERLIQRNERVGQEYLDRIRARENGGFTIRTLLLRGADVRTGLIRAIAEEAPDLVLIAAHGRARRLDVPFGSVTNHLIAHSSVPLLIVRRHPTHLAQREAAMAHHTPLRLPTHDQC